MTTMTITTKGGFKNPLSVIERRWLKVWTLGHVVLLSTIYMLDSMSHRTFDQTIQAWDANIFQNIARYGYFEHQSTPHSVAFFPGLPVILGLTKNFTAGNWVVAELLIAYVSGSIALVGLARLHPAAPKFMLMSPATIFLMLGYSESPYLAFAVWAWYHTRRRHYWAAGWLLAGACSLRVEGLFLWISLMLMGKSVKLMIGLITPLLYELFLFVHTHDWLAWSHAEAAGWNRRTEWPWDTWEASWHYAGWAGGSYGGEEKVEIFCAIVMLLFCIIFLIDKDWPSLVYCCITMMTLTTSDFYMSIPRALLVVFPIWVRLARSRETVRWGWLSVAAPVMVMISYFYLTGQWAG
jgi:hypothetical protein